MKKAVVYARVSSKEQEQEGFSIPAQLKLLKEYALSQGFDVVKEYTDSESAKRVGRTSFRLMLEDLQEGAANVILVEKTDRLTRNFHDLVPLKQLIESQGLEIHLVKESQTIGPNTNSHAKFVFNMKVSLAELYSDNLSEEIRKGQREKAHQGWYPHPPPYGYKGKDGKIVAIPNEAALVTRLYQLYATGQHTMEQIPGVLANEGFVYRPSIQKIPVSRVEVLLKHPFYRGYFEFKGKTYPGNHERFISDELITQVEKALRLKGHKNTIRHFLFQGLITCAYCGCQVVGEIQKQKYIYYSCTNAKKDCKRLFVREEVVEQAIESLTESIKPTEAQYAWLKSILQSSHEEEAAFHQLSIERVQKQVTRTEAMLSRIYDDLLADIIDEPLYQKKRQELTEHRQKLAVELARHQKADSAYQQRGVQILEIAKNVSLFYKSQPIAIKREVLKILLSNFTLEGKVPKPELHFAFAGFREILEKESKVEATGIEPATSCVQSRRSTN